MRYTGIQPQYFPRLHYFARILQTDFFVIRDEVQFVRKHKYPDGRNDYSYQSTSPIKTTSGIFNLNLPLHNPGYSPINKIKLTADKSWIGKQAKTLEYSYAKAPFFKQTYSDIVEILNQENKLLVRLTVLSTIWGLLRILGQEKMKINQMNLDITNSKLAKQKEVRLKRISLASRILNKKTSQNLNANEKILTLIKKVGATEDYCGGTAHTAYMDEDLFKKQGISVRVQDWKCPEYPQIHDKKRFIPDLSIIDLLMNVHPKQAKIILTT